MPIKKVQTNISQEDIAAKGMDYYLHKQKIKSLEAKIKELRKPLEGYINQEGTTTPTGTKLAHLPFGGKEVIMQNVYRCQRVLVAEAVDIAKVIPEISDCIETVEYFREDVLAAKIEEGLVSEDILKRLYEVKDSYAFSVSVKDKFNEKDLDL